MGHHKYLIVGGGMTADAAVNGIRSIDSTGSIGIISSEADPPYNRPPLTKGLWKGDSLDSIWRKTQDQNVSMHLGRTAIEIDTVSKRVKDSDGEIYSWEKLLLATGGSPRRLPFGDDNIIYYRTLKDYYKLCQLIEKGKRFVVIGGGFIGSEIAAALTLNQKEVVMLFPGMGIGDRVFPKDLSTFVTDFFKQKGVDVRTGQKVTGVAKRDAKIVIQTETHTEIEVDGVLAGLGITPNLDLARAANINVDDGILVDEYLRTNHLDIHAAGDVARFYNPALEKRIRVEHEDNANTMGRIAGVNIAGRPEPYTHLPSFYSDLFELGYEAVGELDSRLETFADWKQPNREGVIYYMQNKRVRGVLLWNVWGKVDAARRLIAQPGPFRPEDLVGRGGIL